MITIKDFLETIQYKITDGADYCWQCYGPNARSMDYWNGKHDNNGVTICMVFDTKTQVVYEMEAWNSAKSREYRWIHPDYRAVIKAEATKRGVDHSQSFDDNKFIDLEVAEDMLEKATAIVNGEDYDDRVIVPLTLDKEQMLMLMTLAHEADLTLNQFVEKVLRAEIERLEEQPTWP